MKAFIRTHKWLFVAVILGLLARLLCSFLPGSGDINNHLGWSNDYLWHGAAGFYDREYRIRVGVIEPNYPPLSIWMFVAVRILHSWVGSLVWFLNIHIPVFPSSLVSAVQSPLLLPAMMRWPAIMADGGIAVLAYLFMRRLARSRSSVALGAAIAVLANPAFIYNSAIWGQIDALPVCLILAALYVLLYTRWYGWAVLLFVCALLTKQTSIVLLPLFAWLLVHRAGIRRSILYILGAIVLMSAALTPFWPGGSFAAFTVRTYLFKILMAAGLPYLSNHAFNVWGIVTGFGQINAAHPWLGLPSSVWAYVIAAVLYIILLGIHIRRKESALSVLALAALIAWGMFLFLPRMHERHLLTALPFLLIWTSATRKHWIYWFVSAFHLLNLYHGRWYPSIPYAQAVLSDMRVLTVVTTGSIMLFMYVCSQYYWNSMIHKDNQ